MLAFMICVTHYTLKRFILFNFSNNPFGNFDFYLLCTRVEKNRLRYFSLQEAHRCKESIILGFWILILKFQVKAKTLWSSRGNHLKSPTWKCTEIRVELTKSNRVLQIFIGMELLREYQWVLSDEGLYYHPL